VRGVRWCIQVSVGDPGGRGTLKTTLLFTFSHLSSTQSYTHTDTHAGNGKRTDRLSQCCHALHEYTHTIIQRSHTSHPHTHVYTHIHTHTQHSHSCKNTHPQTHTTHTHTCTHTHAHTHMYTHTRTHTNMSTLTCTHTHTYTHTHSIIHI